MPGIHFATVRARIPLADVLKLIGFFPCKTSRDQVRGPCPLHHSAASITLAPKKLIRTRRASEGSASEPSLARRVSMC